MALRASIRYMPPYPADALLACPACCLPSAGAVPGLLIRGLHLPLLACPCVVPRTACARSREVLERLKSVPPVPGTKPPILVYLGVLLQRGKLNTLESAELARCASGSGGALIHQGANLYLQPHIEGAQHATCTRNLYLQPRIEGRSMQRARQSAALRLGASGSTDPAF
jgi:hypothetical protein